MTDQDKLMREIFGLRVEAEGPLLREPWVGNRKGRCCRTQGWGFGDHPRAHEAV